MSGPRGPSVMAARGLRIVSMAAELGADRDELLRCLGVSEAQGQDPDARISLRALIAMWTLAMKSTRATGLPIAIASRAELAGYADFGYALYTARSAEEAMSRLMRFHDVIDSTGRWRFAAGPERVVFTWRREGPRALGMRAANEQSLATFVHVGRKIIGADVQLEEVTFRHPRPERELPAHDAHFGCPLRFDAQEDSVALSSSMLARVPFGSNRLLSAQFLVRLDERLRALAEGKSCVTEIAHEIAARLEDGIPTLAELAQARGSSERTLRRRLDEEGVSFQQLLVKVQREQAIASLRASGSVRHAALAAGYLDVSAFARAFRRWTGHAPSEYHAGS